MAWRFTFIIFLFFLLSKTQPAAKLSTNIVAIIDVNSPLSKQRITAMNVFVQNYNNSNSTSHNISLVLQEDSGNTFQLVKSVEKLIKEQPVQAVIGMTTWSKAALVAELGSSMIVPVLSLVADSSPHNNRWPFLVQMVPNGLQQLKFASNIVQSCNWHRVVLIYEQGIYDGDYVEFSQELLRAGSVIDYTLAFPPFSSISEHYIEEEMKKLDRVQSRVFIVLRLSFELTGILFIKAKSMGFMKKESAWLVTDTVAGFLEYFVNSSMISSMEGVIGIRTSYSRDTQSFKNFNKQFQQHFRAEYPHETEMIPGIHALRAYDSITVIADALDKRGNQSLPEGILSSNFTGMSGQILFKNRKLLYLPKYEIVNVNDKKINKIVYLQSEFDVQMKKLNGILWPGKLERIPNGWVMPTKGRPLIIGVPGKAPIENFVKITRNGNSSEIYFDGYCIRVFREVVRTLYDMKSYSLPIEFREFNGSYDDLVDCLANKTYDAIVGDLTIIAERWEKVEYTQPFTESGLVTVVPVSPADEGLIFFKPFELDLWLGTGVLMLYTMFMVWFMERGSNPDFSGSWREQLGHALWFAFSSLFLAHREKIQRNYTRVVVVVWLFVALILTQSFTASLTSMLTVPRLISMDINSLGMTNASVGCDDNTFMTAFLEGTLGYKKENVVNLWSKEDYLHAFQNGSIKAAILEIPYAKVFVNDYCNKYVITGSTYRFGGFGFAFQKGSPLASDVSEAILNISEQGTLKMLQENYITTSSCSLDSTTSADNVDGLTLKNFWGLFRFSIAISTISFILLIVNNLRSYLHARSQEEVIMSIVMSLWEWKRKIGRYF